MPMQYILFYYSFIANLSKKNPKKTKPKPKKQRILYDWHNLGSYLLLLPEIASGTNRSRSAFTPP